MCWVSTSAECNISPWHEAHCGSPQQGTRGPVGSQSVKCEWPSLEILFLDRRFGVCVLKGL